MVHKLFLMLTLLLLVGGLTARAIDEEGALMSEIYSGQADGLPYSDEVLRHKRFLGGLISLGVKIGKAIHKKIKEARHG